MTEGLGTRIRKRRMELKLGQKELAKRLGVTQGSVAQMESGIRFPSHDALLKISDALKVSVEYLLKGKEADIINIGGLNAGDRRLMRRFAEFLLWEEKEH